MKFNRRIMFYVFVALVGVFAFSYYLISNPKGGGRVLGAQINSFYGSKLANIDKPPQKKEGTADPIINAKSAILIESDRSYPLYIKNADANVPIASITKIMTAAVALDIYSLNDVIEVKKDSVEIEGSKMGLKEGEKITVQNLLYGLLIPSGNDAANTLSEGKISREEFVKKMNEKARDLGLTDTEFKDPAGLDDSGHSTARDIAVIFAYVLKNNTFDKVVSTSDIEISSVDGSEKHQLKNSNRLVNGEMPFDGVIGGKTGFTPDAGHGLVCAASRDGHMLVSVVLNTDSSSVAASALETRKLLSWGFDSFSFN